jgi:hypothetical protein
MSTVSGRFDLSDDASSDPNSVWTSDAYAFDTDNTTYAVTSTSGGVDSNYLFGGGSSVAGAGTISQVQVRIKGRVQAETDYVYGAVYTDGLGELLGTASYNGILPGWGNYVTLNAPSGGWDWTKVAALEVKFYLVRGALAYYGRIYDSDILVTYTATVGLAGASAGVAAVSGAILRTRGLVGASAGVATVAGALEALVKLLAGLSTGVAAVSGGITRDRGLIGRSDGVAAVTGLITGLWVLAGSSAGKATVSGVFGKDVFLAGDSDGLAIVSALVRALRPLAGSSAGMATVSGLVLRSRSLHGSAAGVATVTGSPSRLLRLMGVSAGVATASGDIESFLSLAGVSHGQAAVSALVSLMKLLVGASHGVGSMAVVLLRIPYMTDLLVVELDASDSSVVIEDSDSYVEFD